MSSARDSLEFDLNQSEVFKYHIESISEIFELLEYLISSKHVTADEEHQQ